VTSTLDLLSFRTQNAAYCRGDLVPERIKKIKEKIKVENKEKKERERKIR
jgi:hypothetical protein